MNVNRKLDRFKQWAGERMGGEVKTVVSDDFKSLEQEMTHRHDGIIAQLIFVASHGRSRRWKGVLRKLTLSVWQAWIGCRRQ
jgi:hypothetical protein